MRTTKESEEEKNRRVGEREEQKGERGRKLNE